MMDETRKNNFGRSSGSEKRPYGRRVAARLFPLDDEENPQNDEENANNRRNLNENFQNRPTSSGQEDLLQWRNSLENVRAIGRDDTIMNMNNEDNTFKWFDTERDRVRDTEEGERQARQRSQERERGRGEQCSQEGERRREGRSVRGRPCEEGEQVPPSGQNEQPGQAVQGGQNGRDANYFGVSSYVGFPNIIGGYTYASFFSVPFMEQGGLALRLSGCNPFNANRSGGNNEEIREERGGNNSNVQAQPNERVANANGSGQDRAQNINGIHNGRIFRYTSTVAFAHRSHNGEVLSEMLSLRDNHVFDVMDITEYSDAITRICINSDLAQAMIAHLDCLRAMLRRNLTSAWTHQMACVNAVTRLLNDPHRRQESWTRPVLHTVNYDFRVITERLSSTGSQSGSLVRFGWTVSHTICLVHRGGCQCEVHYHTRRFYRR